MRGKFSRGFTLIELLVVVLIIGILAAVALPQYRLAVAKSHLATVQPIVTSLREAEHLYYLEHGTYTPAISSLVLKIKSDATTGGMISDHFHLNMNRDRFSVSYCPNSGYDNGSTKCLSNMLFVYTEYWDSSVSPTCSVRSQQTLSNKLCAFVLKEW